MATNSNWWRQSRTLFGTLGQKTFFVDWDFGSNNNDGDGTPEHPFATITHGYNKLVAAGYSPSGCVVRGHGNEAFVGNHSFQIVGDYLGAAVLDGGGTALITYCTMRNMIIMNAGTTIDVDYSVSPYGNNIRAAFAGCGRAGGAYGAGDAFNVSGVVSSPNIIINSKMYRGCIGGIQATGGNIYSKIKCTPYVANQNTCGVTFGGRDLSATARIGNCVVYDLPLQVRATNKSAQTNALFAYRWIFGKVDFIFEHNDNFSQCLFANDCRMFYVDKLSGAEYVNKRLKIIPEVGENETPSFTYVSTDTELDFTGTATGGAMKVTGAGITNFYAALVALYNAGHITTNPASYFDANCVFANVPSTGIFNNPEENDFTTKENSPAVINQWHYFGALPPSLNVPILGTGNSGSDGVAGCWDNRSIDGCLKVEDGLIKIDTASQETAGRIFSKVIKTNPYEVQYNGFYANLTRRVKNGWIASKNNPFGTVITPDANLEATLTADTKYIVKGSKVTFNGEMYDPHSTIDTTGISSLGVQFETSSGKLITIVDANIPDVIYCRCRSMVYARAELGDNLKPQITYFNDGEGYIKFHNRVIVPNESFICDNAEPFYVCDAQGVVDATAEDYSIAVIFDDRETIPEGEERIGGETKWIPAQKFGEYFAMKNAGAITELEIPQIGYVPKSSGHYMCFTKNGGGSQISGYKSILNQAFMQFAVFVNIISELDVDVEE